MPFLFIILIVLFTLNLTVGAVQIDLLDVLRILFGAESDIPQAWRYIIMDSRLPAAVTALLAGVALSVSGLLLQTVFRNPLAGPSVFGINSGASFAVSMLMLLSGGAVSAVSATLGASLAIIAAAMLGAMLVTAIILGLSMVLRSNIMLLIVGMMIGYLANSAISLLSFFATEESLHAYTVWGLGSFSSTTSAQLPLLAVSVILPTIGCIASIKPLNALLLGENYAMNMGYNVRKIRNIVLILSSTLAAVATAFCGPISFLGIAVPHIARLITSSDNHQRLLPYTILTGANIALLCNLVCILPFNSSVLPINAITPLIGAPVIIWIVLRK